MTLIMTLLLRDEVDIVSENIEFHLARGVDHIIATDNGSSDGTTEILEDYERAGVLTLLREPSEDYLQAPWVNRMAFMARDQFGAEWILNNDADEFWRPPNHAGGHLGNLKAALLGRSARALTCQRHNMIAPREDLESRHWRDALTWRAGNRRKRVPKLANPLTDPLRLPFFLYDLPSKVMVRGAGLVEISKGCHSARFDSPVTAEPCDIVIYHFPIRSKAKFRVSVAHIAQALARDPSLGPRTSWKYKRWGNMLEEDGDLERAFSEALPSRTGMWRHRLMARVVRDPVMLDELDELVPRSG